MVVDINVGMERTGVAPGRPALEIARAIDRAPGVRLAGIMGYEGHVLTAWPNEEKRAGTIAAVAGLIESRRLIEDDGMTGRDRQRRRLGQLHVRRVTRRPDRAAGRAAAA